MALLGIGVARPSSSIFLGAASSSTWTPRAAITLVSLALLLLCCTCLLDCRTCSLFVGGVLFRRSYTDRATPPMVEVAWIGNGRMSHRATSNRRGLSCPEALHLSEEPA